MTLFAKEHGNACAAYNNLRSTRSEHGTAAREHCDDLWRDYEPFADKNFLDEFALHLHERWFEMYLTVSLLRAGLNVQCPKPGPDNLLTVNGQRLWIEATCASPGEPGRPDAVPAPVYAKAGEQPEARPVPQNQMVLRIRNSLATKETVVRDYIRAGIVAEGEPVAIAINVHAVHWAWVDMGKYMEQSLYGLGNLAIAIDPKTLQVVDRQRQQLTHITKHNGAEVRVQPFLDESMPHISAVLAAGADAGNLRSYLGQDYMLFPNVTAAIPWPTGAIPLGQETVIAPVEDGWEGTSISYDPPRC